MKNINNRPYFFKPHIKRILKVLVILGILNGLNLGFGPQLFPNPIQNTQAGFSTISENFSTTTNMDASNTTAIGWGSGTISQSFPDPIIVSSYDTTSLVEDILVVGNITYITDDTNGVKIFDTTVKSNPVLLSSYATSSANGIDLHGDLLFIADGFSGLIILNVSDPSNPTLKGSLAPIQYSRDIVVDGNYAYMADNQGGFRVVDITNPASPTAVTSLATPEATWEVAIDGNLAYVADGNTGILVVNITNPASISLVSTYNTPGVAYSVIVEGDVAYIADGSGGLNIANVSNPLAVTQIAITSSGGSAQDEFLVGSILYSSEGSQGIRILNVSDPAIPIAIGTYDTPGVSYSTFVAGEYAYIADAASGLQIMKISEYRSIREHGLYTDVSIVQDMEIIGNYAYLADHGNFLSIVDISDPEFPTQIAQYNPTTLIGYGIDVEGDFAYLAGAGYGFHSVDISNPYSPVLLDNVDTGYGQKVAVSGDYAYVADSDNGLVVVDISDPYNLVIAQSTGIGLGYDIEIRGDYAYMAAFTNGLYIFDIQNPLSPVLVGSYNTANAARGVDIIGNIAVVADGSTGIYTFDISNPFNPIVLDTFKPVSNPTSVSIDPSGELVAVGSSSYSGVSIVNISNPSDIKSFTSYIGNDNVYSVHSNGHYIFAGTFVDLGVVELKRHFSNQYSSVLAQSKAIQTIPPNTDIIKVSTSAIETKPTYTNIEYYVSTNNGHDWTRVYNNGFLYSVNPGISFIWLVNLTVQGNGYFKPASISSLSFELEYQLQDEITLSTPIDGTVSSGTTPLLAWEAVVGASSYQVQIDKFFSFNSVDLITVNTTELTYTTPSLSEGLWYWRVVAIDDQGYFSVYSSYSEYYVDLTSPTIDSPADIIMTEGTSGNQIIWTPSDMHPASYIVNHNGSLYSQDTWNGGAISVDIDGSSYGVHLYEIEVIDEAGNSIKDLVQVTTNDLTAPIIDHPADIVYQEGSTGNTITWNPVDRNPSSYYIQRNNDVIKNGDWDGSSIILDIDGLEPGTFAFILNVFDQEEQTAQDTVLVTVEANTNINSNSNTGSQSTPPSNSSKPSNEDDGPLNWAIVFFVLGLLSVKRILSKRRK